MLFELTKIPQECDYDLARSIVQDLGPSELSYKGKPILTFLLKVNPPPRLKAVGIDDIKLVEYNIKTMLISWYVVRTPHSTYLMYYRSFHEPTTGASLAYSLPLQQIEHVITIKL